MLVMKFKLGSITLHVAGEVIQEPDQSFNPLAFAPRALVHQNDLAAAQILLPGSRVTYRYLLHGSALAQLTAGNNGFLPACRQDKNC